MCAGAQSRGATSPRHSATPPSPPPSWLYDESAAPVLYRRASRRNVRVTHHQKPDGFSGSPKPTVPVFVPACSRFVSVFTALALAAAGRSVSALVAVFCEWIGALRRPRSAGVSWQLESCRRAAPYVSSLATDFEIASNSEMRMRKFAQLNTARWRSASAIRKCRDWGWRCEGSFAVAPKREAKTSPGRSASQAPWLPRSSPATARAATAGSRQLGAKKKFWKNQTPQKKRA